MFTARYELNTIQASLSIKTVNVCWDLGKVSIAPGIPYLITPNF